MLSHFKFTLGWIIRTDSFCLSIHWLFHNSINFNLQSSSLIYCSNYCDCTKSLCLWAYSSKILRHNIYANIIRTSRKANDKDLQGLGQVLFKTLKEIKNLGLQGEQGKELKGQKIWKIFISLQKRKHSVIRRNLKAS